MSAVKCTVLVHPRVNEKIWAYVDLAYDEISFVGECKVSQKGNEITAFVEELTFLKQWNTGGSTFMDPGAVSAYLKSLGAEMPGDAPNVFCGHSHVNMGVFWSGTDEECVKSFLDRGLTASVVFNKKREWLGRFDTLMGKGDKLHQVTLDAEYKVAGVTYNVKAECEKNYKELVTHGTMGRDLTDPRSRELQEKEDAARKAGGGTYAPVHGGGGGYMGRGGYGGTWTRCEGCEAKEICASPVFDSQKIGCWGLQDLVIVGELAQKHWEQARRMGKVKELQSWKDKQRALAEKEAKEAKKAPVANAARVKVMTPEVLEATKPGEIVKAGALAGFKRCLNPMCAFFMAPGNANFGRGWCVECETKFDLGKRAKDHGALVGQAYRMCKSERCTNYVYSDSALFSSGFCSACAAGL